MDARADGTASARLTVKTVADPDPSFVDGEDSDHEAYKTSGARISPHMIHTRCVKLLSLGLGSAAFLRWLELRDGETEEPGEIVLHHLAGP